MTHGPLVGTGLPLREVQAILQSLLYTLVVLEATYVSPSADTTPPPTPFYPLVFLVVYVLAYAVSVCVHVLQKHHPLRSQAGKCDEHSRRPLGFYGD